MKLTTRTINEKTFRFKTVSEDRIAVGDGVTYFGDIQKSWSRLGGWGWQYQISGQTYKTQKEAAWELYRVVSSRNPNFRPLHTV